MSEPQQFFRSLPVDLVELPDGVLLKRGILEVKIAGEGLMSPLQLVFLLSREPSRLDELSDIILPRCKGLSQEQFTNMNSKLIGFGLLEAANEEASQESETPYDVYAWNYAGKSLKSLLAERRVVLLGFNPLTISIASALQQSQVGKIEMLHVPALTASGIEQDQIPSIEDDVPWRLISGDEFNFAITDHALDVVIGATDIGNQSALRQWNELLVKAGTAFLPVSLTDYVGEFGPFVLANATPCLECLRARQNACLEDPKFARAAERSPLNNRAIVGHHPAMITALSAMVAIEVTRFLFGVLDNNELSRLVSIEFSEMQMKSRKVLRIPRCGACSSLNVFSGWAPEKVNYVPRTTSN